MASSNWTNYFLEVTRLLEDGERKYGVANHSYTEYMLERVEISLSTCSDVLHHVEHTEEEELSSELHHLIDSLKLIHQRWQEYSSILDKHPSMRGTMSYQAPARVSSASGLGRPQFHIAKDQLEYLSSLGFQWKEIAALLGVSRMTIYR